MKQKKKVLIIGNTPNAFALIKKMTTNYELFVAPKCDFFKDYATCIDIREDNPAELLEFVLENGIDLTVPISTTTINSDITKIFNDNNQPIFGPTCAASKIVSDKSMIKKLFYKLRIPTPRFGIFEKQNMVLDYIKNLKTPFVIKTNDINSATICTSYHLAKSVVERCFIEKNKRVIVEDYVYGTPFAFYAITDGYKALPIGSSILYRHNLDGNGGQLTSGMGACIPNYKLSDEQEYYLMDNVIYPIIEYLEQEGNPYLGILGIDGIITEDEKIWILGCQSFVQNCDALGILENINNELFALMSSCIIGSFSDEVENIDLMDKAFASLTLNCINKENKENAIQGLNNLEEETIVTIYPNIKQNRYLEYEAEYGNVLLLTSSAPTLTSAIKKVYNEVKDINYSGINYRKDIGI